MRIGISASSIYKFNTTTDGLGVYSHQLVKQLRGLGNQVSEVFFKNKKLIDGAISFPFSYQMQHVFSSIFGFADFASDVNRELDVMHFTDYKVVKCKKIPVVMTLHDPVMVSHPEWCRERFYRLRKLILKNGIAWADRIITISHTMRDAISEHFNLPENKIDVIYNGVDPFWSEDVADIYKKHILKKYDLDKPFFLFVGTLQPRKNICRLLQAYEAMPEAVKCDYRLVLVGHDGWGMTEYADVYAKLQQKKQLIRLKNVSNAELRVLYQCASLYLYPSLYEGFGLPILEAYASGVPVLTSNVSAIPEIAGDAAWLVDPYDVDAIRDGLLSLVDNDELRKQFIEKGKIRVKDFSWETCARETLRCYRKLCPTTSAGHHH